LFAPLPILIFGGLGLLLLFFIPAITCTFDKQQNQIVLEYWVLLAKPTIETYALSNFQAIKIEEYTTKIGNRYNFWLHVQEKKQLLNGDAIVIMGQNYTQASQIAKTIQAFVENSRS
jgi:hypothetical protein